ncbi:MAG: DUF1854 domain-containing protein [Clostridia bacterium]|nr:DUF1854 domain-containing protein [Clostridia bacterium]MBQ1966311.1 DUF1854 domain-containing protein [Clostridia bacterium]
MGRLYIDHDMANFTRKDIILVDMELYDGRKFENLEPRRLFPLSGLEKYITLLNEEGVEVAIIRDLRTLSEDQRRMIESCLEEYYHIPKITRVLSCKEKYGVLTVTAETDRGNVSIEIRNLVHGIKFLYGSRVLFRDNNDNRYEIPNLNLLDRHSRALIDVYL